MKKLRIISMILFLSIVFSVSASAITEIQPDKYIIKEDGRMPPQLVSDLQINTRIGFNPWAIVNFCKNVYNNSADNSFIPVYRSESPSIDPVYLPIQEDLYINTANVELRDTIDTGSDPALTFDYTSNIDLAPDEDGKTTKHAIIIMFYDMPEMYSNGNYKSYYERNDTIDIADEILGYQLVKYIPAGTVGGQEEISSASNITCTLPTDVNPENLHTFGLAVLLLDDTPLPEKVVILENPNEHERIEGLDLVTTPVHLIDVSEDIEDFTAWYPSEPEYDPTVLVGDVDNSGYVRLGDVANMLQSLAGWENVVLNRSAADVNNDGRISLSDAGILLRILADSGELMK